MSETRQYCFAYNLPSDASAVNFVMKTRLLLQAIAIDPEIDVLDAGGFIRIRVLVPEDLGTIADFKLMSLNRNLASPGTDTPKS